MGPYLFQFRCLPVPYGANYIEQRMRTTVPKLDFLTDYKEWLRVQRGAFPTQAQQHDSTRRYLRDGRDAAEWVHNDGVSQAAFMAALMLAYPLSDDPASSGIEAPLNPGNPYNRSVNQVGFDTFGLPHLESLVQEVQTRALKAVRFQK
ncbi:MAG TPA: hypothetical protein VNT26_03485 [Candidatus Sulfotelmatobacter sp.]|nr:hypothetical protein [Candidatus Sulfotelmatobacter sp.]